MREKSERRAGFELYDSSACAATARNSTVCVCNGQKTAGDNSFFDDILLLFGFLVFFCTNRLGVSVLNLVAIRLCETGNFEEFFELIIG